MTDLIALAHQGQDTAPAGIERMVSALASQLTSGPLADLSAGTVDGNGFVTEVQSLVASYATSVDSALLPDFPNVDTLLQPVGKLHRGRRDVAESTGGGWTALEL